MQKTIISRIAILTAWLLAGILVLWVVAISRLTPAKPVPVVLAERPKPPKPPASAGLSYLEVQRPDWFSKMGIGKKKEPVRRATIGTPESQAIFAAFLADLLRDDANGDGLLTGAEVTCAMERGYPRPLIVWMFKTLRERADADQDGRLSAAEHRQFFTKIGARQVAAKPPTAEWVDYDIDKNGRLSRQERALAAAQLDPALAEKHLADERQVGLRQNGQLAPAKPNLSSSSYFVSANHKLNDVDFPPNAYWLPAGLVADRRYPIFPRPDGACNLAAPDALAALADGDGNGWIDDRESHALLWAILKTYDLDHDDQLLGREQRTLDEDLVFDEVLCRFFPNGDKDRDGWFSREEILALLPPILKVYDFNHNGRLDPWEKFRFCRDTWKAQPGTALAHLCNQGRLADQQLDQGQRDIILANIRRRLAPAMNPNWGKTEQEAAWETLINRADANQNGKLEPQEIFQIEQELVFGLNTNQIPTHFILKKPDTGNYISQKDFLELDTDGNGILSLTESDAWRKRFLETHNRPDRNPIIVAPAYLGNPASATLIASFDLDGDGQVSQFETFCQHLLWKDKLANASPSSISLPSSMDQSFAGLYAGFLDWNHDNQLTGAEAKAAKAIFLVLFDQNGDEQLDGNEAGTLFQHGFRFLWKYRPPSPANLLQAVVPAEPIFQPPNQSEPEPESLKNAFETLSGSVKTRAALAGFLDELMKNDKDGDGRLEDDEITVLIGQGMQKIFFQRLDQQLCRFDLNGDGKISPQERELFLDLAGGPASTVHAWISRLDQNGDGRLDHQERNRFSSDDTHPFAASAGLRVTILSNENLTFFLNYHKDAQPVISIKLTNSKTDRLILPTDEICKQADRDRDGWLNPEEALTARRATFLAADRNGSGWIEIEEAEAWTDAAAIETALWRFFPDTDTDHDGWLDQAEIALALPKLLAVYDFNDDGQLDDWERNCLARHLKMAELPANATLGEVRRVGGAADEKQFLENHNEIIDGLSQRLTYLRKSSMRTARSQNWQSILQIADRNGNGQLDLDEAFWLDRQYVIHGEEQQVLQDGAKLYLEACDTNGDGVVTGTESFRIQDKMVELLDQDGNGILSIAECQPLRIHAGKSHLKIAKMYLMGNLFGVFSGNLRRWAGDDKGEKIFSKLLMPYLDLDKDGKITMWEIQSFDNRFSSKNRLAGAGAQSLDENLAKAVPFLDRDHDGKLTDAEKNTAVGILLALADKERLGRIDIGTVEVAHKEFPAFFDDPVVVPPRPARPLARHKLTKQEFLQRYDLNGDGKLSPEEGARAIEDMKNDVQNNIIVPPEEE